MSGVGLACVGWQAHASVMWRRSRARNRVLAEAGVAACANATEVVQKADIVFLMVPGTPDVEKVLSGETKAFAQR